MLKSPVLKAVRVLSSPSSMMALTRIIRTSRPNLNPEPAVSRGAADVDSDHGTAVAGIAAGADGNGGIQGVAFNAGILAFQVGDQDPNNPNEIRFDSDAIASAIDTASSGGADIINMSLGFGFSGTVRLSDGTIVDRTPSAGAQLIGDAMRRAAGRGSLMVVSAGNDGDNLDDFEELADLPAGSVVELGANFPALFAADPGTANGVIVAVGRG